MDCLQKQPKPLMPLKTLDIIFRRRIVPNSQYYFTNRKHAREDKDFYSRPSRPFKVPKTTKLLSYIKYSERKDKMITKAKNALPLALKDNIKIAATRDLSKRLFIPEPPDDVRAVVEIHPEFYTVIEGRPIRTFDDIKLYVNNIRAYAMNRQQIGYRRDLILNIKRSIAKEEQEHDEIVNDYKTHVKNFQRFLTEDYKKACSRVEKADKISEALVAKQAEFLGYVTKITILNNVIFKLDSIRNILKIYRRYLMFVAPLSWRQQYDETLYGKVQSIQFESGEFATDNDLVNTLDIDKTIELAAIELKNSLPVHLYFVNCEQMMFLFRTMELQSREYIMQLTKTTTPYRLLKRRMKQLKQETKQQLDYFQYYIDRINNEIAIELHNEIHLQEKFYRILNGSFYDSVANPDTLKLKICIEYVFEQVFGKCEEGHQNLYEPMKTLEVMYEDYNMRLDSLDFKIVNCARAEAFANDLRLMKNAFKAQRELRAFREMTNAMNKAFLPPAQYKRPTPELSRNPKITKKSGALTKNGEKAPKHKLTEEEREDLIYFTEWCPGSDPAPYLKEYYQIIVPALMKSVKSMAE